MAYDFLNILILNHNETISDLKIRVFWITIFLYFSPKTYAVGSFEYQKHMLKLWVRKYLLFYAENIINLNLNYQNV